jgi:NADPH:quinone reductase-like Zn-dependent oxidoreductase
MRVITQESFGGPEVLTVTETERPRPEVNEVLVRVGATGLNPIDTLVRSGAVPALGEPPFVLGWDVAGVVVEVGSGVHRFAVGDRVFGMPAFPQPANTYAEFVVAKARELAPTPAGLDDVHAAALPLAGLTARQALIGAGRLQPGQRVLVHAGGGGVGHLAIQLAVAAGARVAATASAGKAAFVQELGADPVVDYRSGDLAAALREQVGELDLVLDLVGGSAAEASLPLLRAGGTLATTVRVFDTQLRATVEQSGRRFAGILVEPDGPGLAALAGLVDAGHLRVRVERTYPFGEVADAHRLLEASPGRGSGSGIAGKLALVP